MDDAKGADALPVIRVPVSRADLEAAYVELYAREGYVIDEDSAMRKAAECGAVLDMLAEGCGRASAPKSLDVMADGENFAITE